MPSRPLNDPSDLFFAIGDAILAQGLDVRVGNYDDFDGKARDSTVLIEFERSAPSNRANDGRHGHHYTITLHAVVGRWRKHASLEAINLAAHLERLVADNCWGLPGTQVDMPAQIYASPSIFAPGDGGYDAWGVTFNQTIYLGPSLLEEDPVIGAGSPSLAINVDGIPGEFGSLLE